MTAKAKDRVKELVALLTEWNEAYRKGEEIVPDAVYDAHEEELRKLDPNNSYLKDTGSEEAIDVSRKVTLPISVHSFEKVYCNSDKGDQVTPFLNLPGRKVGTLKYDGAAIVLEYEDGKLTMAYTKGRGGIGQVALAHAKLIPNVPQKPVFMPFQHFYVKCELTMKNSIFAHHFAQTYKNSRNLMSGLLNKKDPNEVANIFKFTEAIAHSIVLPSNKAVAKMEQLNNLFLMGFHVCDSFDFDENDKIDAIYLAKFLADAKKKGDYLCDGVVLEFNEAQVRDQMGWHTNGNPKYGVAFKEQYADSILDTKVTEVRWNVSKNGNLIPTVYYEPIELNGTTCTKASGFNFKFIKDNGIDVGAIIRVQKGGDIIPDIVDVKLRAKHLKLPYTCPACGEKTVLNSTGVHVKCGSSDCWASEIKSIAHFLKTIGVENIAEATVANILDKTSMINIENFIHAKAKDFKCEGVGDKTATKLEDDIKKKLKNIDLAKLIHALDCMGDSIGSTKVQWVIDKYGDIIKYDFEQSEIEELKGFSDKTAERFVEGLDVAKAWIKRNNIKYSIKKNKPVSGRLTGKSFLFSGFRDKNLEEKIKAEGGTIASSVSKNLTTLVVADVNDTSSKITKAKTLGIPVMEKSKFVNQEKLC